MQEIDAVIKHWRAATAAGKRSVLATVVHVEGHSYRKPGARMLVTEVGHVAGAVSGGCVERAVTARAKRVLQTGQPETLVYDGRHRLGCAGQLYILLEPFAPADADAFYSAYERARGGGNGQSRGGFSVRTAFAKTQDARYEGKDLPRRLGTTFVFGEQAFVAREELIDPGDAPVFTEAIAPAPHLVAVGAERDAVALAQLASTQGWDATLVTHPRNPLRALDDVRVLPTDPPALLEAVRPDAQTAFVLMTHNFARDLAYLTALSTADEVGYVGLLGPVHRRERLLTELFDGGAEFPAWLPEKVYGPAGIDIGARMPEQIALSIMAEATAVFAGHGGGASLREKAGGIHEVTA